MTEKPTFTLIIRTKDSGAYLEETLKAVCKQTLQPEQFIAIDSGSTDQTLEVLNRHPEIEVLHIEADDYIPGPVLNLGMEKANEEIVILLNSDAVPYGERVFEDLVRPLQDQRTAAAYARQIPKDNAKTWVRKDYQAAFPDGAAPSWMNLSFCLAAVKRSLWKERPFYSLAWGSEDAEWGSAMLKEGCRIEYVPRAKVIHSHNYSLKGMYGRKFIEGEADAFIPGKNISVLTILKRFIYSIGSDVVFHMKEKDYRDILLVPLRRFVYHWGYLRGWLHGRRRKREGDPSIKMGKNIVLSRYE